MLLRYLLELASFIYIAAAYTTPTRGRAAGNARPSSLAMADFSKELGAQWPLGYFDPLGLMKDADDETFKLFRDIETKHGRVSMLAMVGHEFTTAGVRLPGFESIKSGLACLSDVPIYTLLLTISVIGLVDIGFTSRKDEIESVHEAQSKKVWFFSDGLIRWNKGVELNNGRAAMMGISALMAHERVNNDPYILNALFGSPVPFNP